MKTRISLLAWLAVAGLALTASAGILYDGVDGIGLEWAYGEVVDVVDGDTFEVEYSAGREGLPTTIRPYLYDTPETQNRTDCFGSEATAQAKGFLDDNGNDIWLQHRGHLDPYDRLLAFVYLDREHTDLLASRMIGEGFAWLDVRHGEEQRFINDQTDDETLYDMQMDAQDGEGQGLWNKCPSEEQALADHVVINEVEANPPGSDSGHEWIELYNPTDTAQNLSGWRIVSDPGDGASETEFVIEGSAAIGSENHLVINLTKRLVDNGREEPEILQLQRENEEPVDTVSGLTDDSDDLRCNARIPDGRMIDDEDWQLRTCTREAPNGSVRYDRTLDSSEG